MRELMIENMVRALADRRFPSLVVQNRLEGRPRTQNFERALKAEVRDALWFLTRQWQVGEFIADDAGSPISMRMRLETAPLTKYQAHDQPVEPFDETLPLNAKVERRPVTLVSAERPVALELRLLMGRQWLKLIDGIGYEQDFIDHYKIDAPDPETRDDADRAAAPEVWQWFAATSGRRMDGAALYLHLKANSANRAYDGIAVDPGDRNDLDNAATRFIEWFERLFHQPPSRDATAWIPPRLEYAFDCSAPARAGEQVFTADEYNRGDLDWYDFDLDDRSPGLGDVVPPSAGDLTGVTLAMLPTPVQFEGMPNPRWWAFEDRKTNFGQVDAATTDLAKLLFLEFALVYSNDWFLVPCTLDAGSAATVRGIAVKTVFGERFWIEPTDDGAPPAGRWSAFTLDVKGASEQRRSTLLLLPTAAKVQEGDPLEEAMLVRDELANMVWAIERVVPLANGTSKRGAEAAAETRRFYERELEHRVGPPPPPVPGTAPIRYEVMTSVLENWIPFVPVHVDGSNREIQLQRGALPRVLEGDPDPPAKVTPRTALLREGLDQHPAAPYFVYEEEVPRSGVRALQAYRRARWRKGRTYVWLAARKESGRGEASSKLAFDQIPPTAPPP
jgi:hypothetical protein